MCTYVAILGKGSAHGAADSADGRRHFLSAVTEEKPTVKLRPTQSTLSEACCRPCLVNECKFSRSSFGALNAYVSRCHVTPRPSVYVQAKIRMVCVFVH